MTILPPELPSRRPWLEFQPQFNAGHVLQVLSIVVSMTGAFVYVQARQDNLEKEVKRLEETVKAQQAGSAAAVKDLKDDFQRRMDAISRVLERIDDKLDRKQDRAVP